VLENIEMLQCYKNEEIMKGWKLWG